jgi:hypothetical protein
MGGKKQALAGDLLPPIKNSGERGDLLGFLEVGGGNFSREGEVLGW